MSNSTENTFSAGLACASGGFCVTSFVTSAMPYLQALSALISIAVGAIALYRYFKKKS
jgi:uncharacterized membrane protein YfcA